MFIMNTGRPIRSTSFCSMRVALIGVRVAPGPRSAVAARSNINRPRSRIKLLAHVNITRIHTQPHINTHTLSHVQSLVVCAIVQRSTTPKNWYISERFVKLVCV